MKTLADAFEEESGQIAYNNELIGINKDPGGFKLRIADKREGEFDFQTRMLINCAGPASDKVALLAGIKSEEYELKYCKGDYSRVHNNIGIHATLDLAGSLRLGPDDEYVQKLNYEVDLAKAGAFYESVKNFLPFVEPQDLSVDTAGIRPKLQGPGEGFRDFIIQEEGSRGKASLINLVGIESPGLTASLSIAKRVSAIVKNL